MDTLYDHDGASMLNILFFCHFEVNFQTYIMIGAMLHSITIEHHQKTQGNEQIFQLANVKVYIFQSSYCSII